MFNFEPSFWGIYAYSYLETEITIEPILMIKSLNNLLSWNSNSEGQVTINTSTSYNNHNLRQTSLTINFNNNSVNWYYNTTYTDYSNPVYQLNYDNWTYYYFALN